MSFLPFSRPALGEEELAAVSAVFASGWITTGPKNAALEQAFCELTGNQHAIAVSSATAGLHVTLLALGIQPGDEVITPSLTWVSTLNIITLRRLHHAPGQLFRCITPVHRLIWRQSARWVSATPFR